MKMGRIVMGMLLAGLISSSTPALAAYQPTSDEAVFTRLGDWFATLGKSGFEKESILVQRRTARVAKHAEQGLREAREGLQKGLDSVSGR